MIAIETDDLTKRFRQLRGHRDLVLYPWRRPTQLAVDSVSLQIGEGELSDGSARMAPVWACGRAVRMAQTDGSLSEY